MTRKLQFAEEGPMLQVESYELSKTLRWCDRLINSIPHALTLPSSYTGTMHGCLIPGYCQKTNVTSNNLLSNNKTTEGN